MVSDFADTLALVPTAPLQEMVDTVAFQPFPCMSEWPFAFRKRITPADVRKGPLT